jgi:hypothetical protein
MSSTKIFIGFFIDMQNEFKILKTKVIFRYLRKNKLKGK